MCLLSQVVTWSMSATSTLAVVIRTPRRSIARIVVTVAKWGSSSVSSGQRVLGGIDASAQQCDVPCSAFGQIGGHDAAERSGPARDDIGPIRCELGGEGPRQARAWTQAWHECRLAADRDLIFGAAVEKVLADALARLSAIVSAVDVDEAAPEVGELLVTDDSAQPPDGGLVDSTAVEFRKPVARWR